MKNFYVSYLKLNVAMWTCKVRGKTSNTCFTQKKYLKMTFFRKPFLSTLVTPSIDCFTLDPCFCLFVCPSTCCFPGSLAAWCPRRVGVFNNFGLLLALFGCWVSFRRLQRALNSTTPSSLLYFFLNSCALFDSFTLIQFKEFTSLPPFLAPILWAPIPLELPDSAFELSKCRTTPGD